MLHVSDELWLRNDIQFPRLISEILAVVTITDEEMRELCDSMDLDETQVKSLMDRAGEEWEQIKMDILQGAPDEARST